MFQVVLLTTPCSYLQFKCACVSFFSDICFLVLSIFSFVIQFVFAHSFIYLIQWRDFKGVDCVYISSFSGSIWVYVLSYQSFSNLDYTIPCILCSSIRVDYFSPFLPLVIDPSYLSVSFLFKLIHFGSHIIFHVAFQYLFYNLLRFSILFRSIHLRSINKAFHLDKSLCTLT